MYLDDGTRESCESIVKAPRVMSECTSIEDDGIDSLASCVNCIDELAFMVGDQGDLELLEQNLELFTSSDDGIVDESHVLDDDDCSLDNLLSSVNMNQI